MKRVSVCFVLCFSLLGACTGCGGPGSSVQGTVTIGGQLAQQGTVIFHPVENGPTAYGSIAPDGSYALRVGQGDLSDPNAGGVPAGEYIVTVVVNAPSRPDELVGESGPPKPGPRLTAEKYADQQTSDLRRMVKAGRNVFPLELEGSSADDEASKVDDAKGEKSVESPEEKSPAGGEKATPKEPVEQPAPEGAPTSKENDQPGAAAKEPKQ